METVVASVVGNVLGGNSEKKARKAQSAETSRLEQQRKDEAASAEAARKKKDLQRKATATIFGGSNDNQSVGVGNLGG